MHLFSMTSQQGLILTAVGGFIWVVTTVFMDNPAGERDRDEAGFDLIQKFSDWF